MSTADKTKKSAVISQGSRFGLRFFTPYRWIAAVFSRRARFTPNNDIDALNAYQLRDIGMHERGHDVSPQQVRSQTARFNAMLLMGTNGR